MTTKHYVEYIYHFKYFVKSSTESSSSENIDRDIIYFSKYKNKKEGYISTTRPDYNEGDNITIYYNKNNPNDIRMDLNYASDSTVFITKILTILFQIFCFYKSVKFIRENDEHI